MISLSDIGPLLVDHLGLKPQPLSPLAGFAAEYAAGSASLSREGRTLTENELTKRALSVLANPELLFITILGGGPQPLSQELACHAPGIEADVFVSVTPGPEGSLLVQWHQSPWEFLARWLNTIASGVTETTPNLIPPPVNSEALIYMLHTVDLYNMVRLQSLLDHEKSKERPVMAPEEFATSLATSLSGGDTRWLLPTFLSLTPGVSIEGLGGDEAALEHLERLDFFRTSQDENGNDLLAFGDAAIIMGEEFSRLWSGSAGFRIAFAGDHALMPQTSGFLAATGLSNHLFLITGEEHNGQPLINHQALTRDELENVMAPILGLALDKVGRSCASCGKPAIPGANFCGYCGSKLD